MKIKIIRLSPGKFLLFFILFILIMGLLFFLLFPLFLLLLIMGVIFIIYLKFKKRLKDIWLNFKKKRIKIEYKDNSGKIDIHFPKKIPIEGENENKKYNNITDPFVIYLKKLGAKIDEKGNIYFRGYKVYPIFKKSYPINEIISLDYPDDIDAVVLGLKGEPYEPKFLFLIPKENLKRRMKLDEIKRFII